jgi:hypothetical protein
MSASFPHGRVAAIAGIAVLAAAAVGTSLAVSGSSSSSSSSHVASMPLDGRSHAALKVTAGTQLLQLSVASLPGTLLRVSTPDDAPVRPVLSGSEPVRLSLDGAPGGQDHGRAYPVSVVLNSSVGWGLDFAGGTQRTVADLRGGKVDDIAVTAGSDILDLSLPRPAGTVGLLLTGGVSQFLLSLPGGVPAQVAVGGGAAQVTVDGQTRTGVAGGTVITPPGWAAASSRFDIDAAAGVSDLTVRRW